MDYQTLDFALADNVATITMNRPDDANALDLTMGEELVDVSIRCDEDDAIRAVILTGAGKMFSAGGDLSVFAGAGDNAAAVIKKMAGDLHMALSRFNRMDAPIIAAINGTAAGAGFSIAAATDLAVCVDSAKFTMAYTNAGLSPDGSSSYFLPRRIGDRRTRELMLTNRVLSAEEALNWGIVNQVVAAEELTDTVNKLAGNLAKGPTRAYGQVKKLLNGTFDNGMETQMEFETRGIAEMVRTADGQEGIAAFLAKRKPVFSGK